MASPPVRIVVRALEGFVERRVTQLALDIVANLVAAPSEGGTPVDTGWARANWQPNIGGPARTTSGSRESVTSAAQNEGLGALVGWRLASGAKIHITNNVPYIGFLNQGTSKQAPAGFVQAAIRRAVGGA